MAAGLPPCYVSQPVSLGTPSRTWALARSETAHSNTRASASSPGQDGDGRRSVEVDLLEQPPTIPVRQNGRQLPLEPRHVERRDIAGTRSGWCGVSQSSTAIWRASGSSSHRPPSHHSEHPDGGSSQKVVLLGVRPGTRRGPYDNEEMTVAGTADDMKGRAKEAVGDLTDDDDLKREGKADRAAGTVKDKLEDAKDWAEDQVDKVKDHVDKDKT